jgi:hypothetical protein
MIRKTQEEVNFWFQDNAVKSALDLTLIEKKLHNNGLDIPNIIIINKNGSTYEDFAHWYYDETKISKYPKTYLECREMLGESAYYGFSIYTTLQNLIICRNAYWKIAGEHMGLDKPWEPTTETVYGISRTANLICQTHRYGNSKILEFPTKEMRDEFYENFKDLIELCKTLL